jgi:copper chaperone
LSRGLTAIDIMGGRELLEQFVVIVPDGVALRGGQLRRTGGRQRVEFGAKRTDAMDPALRLRAIVAERGASRASEVGHAKLIVMEQLILNVTGMTCGGCENSVKRAVARIDGVAQVTASHSDNRVVVEYDAAKADRARIADAITKAGYTVSAGQ